MIEISSQLRELERTEQLVDELVDASVARDAIARQLLMSLGDPSGASLQSYDAYNTSRAMHICMVVEHSDGATSAHSHFIDDEHRAGLSEGVITGLGEIAMLNQAVGRSYYESDFYRGI